MARNSEKRLTGLNRFLEAKAEEEQKLKGSLSKPRPQLYNLRTADDIKKWIPSIQREIEYCLQQIEGVESRSYPDYKLKEFEERVEALEQEHKRFVRKFHSLDPSSDTPWQPRGYTRKRSHPSANANVPLLQKELRSPLVNETREETIEKHSQSISVKQPLTPQHHRPFPHQSHTLPLLPVQISPKRCSLPGITYSSSSDDEG